MEVPIHGFFRGLQLRLQQALPSATAGSTARLVRFVVIMLVVYAGILAFGLNEFRKTPIGFIPQLDRRLSSSS